MGSNGHLLMCVLVCVSHCTLASFRVRASESTSLTLAEDLSSTSCAPNDSHVCFTQCLADPCCLAVTHAPPPCHLSYLPTEALDFVKEVESPLSVDECSCSVTAGGTGGQPFSLKSQFEAAPSAVVQVTVYFKAANRKEIANVGLRWESGEQGLAGYSTDHSDVCELKSGERITRVTLYESLPKHVIGGIRLETTAKTCGTYGVQSEAGKVVEGHQLLYVEGRRGALLDAFTAVFDHGCVTHGVTGQGGNLSEG